MGQRKVKEIEVADVVAKIYKDSDTGEHIAKFWERGERRKSWDYFTDDLDDAVGTAKGVLLREAGTGRAIKPGAKSWAFGVIQSGGRDTNGNPRQAIALYDANGSELIVIDVGYLGASQAVTAEGYAKPFTKDGGPLVRSYGVMKAREFNQWIKNSKRKANPAKRKAMKTPGEHFNTPKPKTTGKYMLRVNKGNRTLYVVKRHANGALEASPDIKDAKHYAKSTAFRMANEYMALGIKSVVPVAVKKR